MLGARGGASEQPGPGAVRAVHGAVRPPAAEVDQPLHDEHLLREQPAARGRVRLLAHRAAGLVHAVGLAVAHVGRPLVSVEEAQLVTAVGVLLPPLGAGRVTRLDHPVRVGRRRGPAPEIPGIPGVGAWPHAPLRCSRRTHLGRALHLRPGCGDPLLRGALRLDHRRLRAGVRRLSHLPARRRPDRRMHAERPHHRRRNSWSVYLESDDVEATLRMAEANGGTDLDRAAAGRRPRAHGVRQRPERAP